MNGTRAGVNWEIRRRKLQLEMMKAQNRAQNLRGDAHQRAQWERELRAAQEALYAHNFARV